MKSSRLYVLLDKDICGNTNALIRTAKQIKSCGADVLQLRFKGDDTKDLIRMAAQLRCALEHARTLLIIDDRPDIALFCNADGVHLGQDDIPPIIARRILGKDKLIGLSCHSLNQVKLAEKNRDVDYISIGPVFSTSLKPNRKPLGIDIAKRARKNSTKPLFAIGGINLKNLNDVIGCGINSVAVCRAVCEASNRASAVKKIKQRLIKKNK